MPDKKQNLTASTTSTAHTITSNKLVPAATAQTNADVRKCRVCLEEGSPDSQDDQTFIVPCNCRGGLMYGHQKCLLQWARAAAGKKMENGQPLQNIRCQLCRHKLNLEHTRILGFTTKDLLLKKVNEYKALLTVCLSLLIACLGALGFLLYIQLSKFGYLAASSKIAVYVCWGVLSGCLLFWLAKIICSFLVCRRTQVSRINNREDRVSYRHRKQMPSETLQRIEPVL